MKLLVANYTSFYALRQDLKKKVMKVRAAANEDQKPELIGVRVAQPETMNGAIFHDIVALYNALAPRQKSQMIGALDRVKRQFAAAAPQLVVAALPDSLRKAA